MEVLMVVAMDHMVVLMEILMVVLMVLVMEILMVATVTAMVMENLMEVTGKFKAEVLVTTLSHNLGWQNFLGLLVSLKLCWLDSP